MNCSRISLAGLIVSTCLGVAQADVKLASVFSSNMVLQRGIPVPVWGKADPGEAVRVTFAGQVRECVADATGRWNVMLDSLQASRRPARLAVKGRNEVVLDNILVGEVWLCSGQSNMQMGIGSVRDAQKEIAGADRPEIRLMTIPMVTASSPEEDVRTEGWKICTPVTVSSNSGTWSGFSAVAYFFGRELNQELGVPVGLIGSYWGGTPAQAWTPIEALKANPALEHYVDRYMREAFLVKGAAQLSKQERARIAADLQIRAVDTGNKGEAEGWAREDTDLSSWEQVTVPKGWFQDKHLYGAVWFRRAIELPASWAGKDITVTLGAVDDFDTTYFNGTRIGAVGKETPNCWMVPRHYTVPGRLVKAGRNSLAVRVFNDYGAGGFTSPAADLAVTAPQGSPEPPLPLAGDWWRKVEGGREYPLLPSLQSCPSCLYNAMISPLVPFAIRGAIWYQGEANAGQAYEYRTLFPAMIRSWRKKWGQGDFPFYFVQLANFMDITSQPSESAWAELREAQSLALSTFNSGMAVAIDIGEARDIHPRNKQEVGRRLALNALANTYGKRVEYSGPVARAMVLEGQVVRIRFAHAGKGLKSSDGGPLTGFAVCGADRKFVWADARIKGDCVLVSSPAIKNPVAVRYAWASNPVCNLVNKSGLPASPFRTDSFQGVTEF